MCGKLGPLAGNGLTNTNGELKLFFIGFKISFKDKYQPVETFTSLGMRLNRVESWEASSL